MDDFPPICKQDPLDVRVMFMKEYFETTGKVIKISDIPDEMYGGAMLVAKNKKSLKRKMTDAEYLEDTPEVVAKVVKTSAPTTSDVPPEQEAPEDEDSEVLIRKRRFVEQVDSEQIINVTSGTSSLSSDPDSDSSDFDEPSQNIIDYINRHSKKTDSSSTSSYPIPLQVILPKLVAETVVSAPVPAAASEPSAAATIHTHTINKTPEKATTSVPKQTDLVNQQQQQPEPTNQTTTQQTSTSTQITQNPNNTFSTKDYSRTYC